MTKTYLTFTHHKCGAIYTKTIQATSKEAARAEVLTHYNPKAINKITVVVK